MINEIRIKNFRTIKDASISGCRRINLVVGDNGSGKTALLEALFLAMGKSPEVALRLRNWRGLESTFSGSPQIVSDAIWRDYFLDYDTDKQVRIELDGSHAIARHLFISYKSSSIELPLSSPRDEDYQFPKQVVFEYIYPGLTQSYSVEPRLTDGNIAFPPPPFDAPTEVYFFAANRTYSSGEAASRLSVLSRAFRSTEIVDIFRSVFPSVIDLSVEVIAGQPAVFAQIDGRREKVPLPSASGAMNKVASVLLAIPQQRGCVFLIDEIENGIYYDRLPAVWRSILHFCKLYDGQVFATTHSAECLRAAALVAEESPEEFAVIHTGPNGPRKFEGKKLIDAMNFDIEIR
jgi:hypothetical protein